MVRRVLLALFVLCGAVTVVFLIVRIVPGDPALLIAGESATAQQLQQLRKVMGLDQPLIAQYGQYVADAATGNFGTSYTQGLPVADLIGQVLPNTALLAGLACALALLISFPLGLLAAARVGRPTDLVVTTVSLFVQSLPGFWVGVVLLLVFARQLQWLPSSGLATPSALILPTIVLSLPFIAMLTRLIRSGLIEVGGEGYITTARAKGLPERTVIFPHAIRNALIPIITVVGLEFGTLLGGAVITETVFSFPGIGKLLITSIITRDYNVAQACVVVIAALFVFINLFVDLLYAYIDPRVRLAK